MALTRRNPVVLSDTNRQVLETWQQEFERGWDEGRLATWVRQLPPSESPLRLAALLELVKIDLRRLWLLGKPRAVESYLQDYPELGAAREVLLDLICQEFDVRQEVGAAASVPEFAKRFPRLAGDLARRIDEAEAARTPRPSPPSPSTLQPPQTLQQDHPPASPGPVPEQFGRYRILRRLGQGGMATVYLGQDSQLDRPVALKVPHFRSDDGPELLERFRREARAAALLHHPNLCPVYDVGEINGVPFMTMAYVEGHPLAKFVSAEHRLPQRQVASVARKIALALAHAHAQGVLHRDLKPSNVILTPRGEPIVTDFGLARRTDGSDVKLTKTGAILGTPAYMSPEQVNGDPNLAAPTDIYSLGVILYELLTGNLPFDGNPAMLLALILTQEPPPPINRRPDLDRKLDAICRKAMAKRLADRYATMDELAAALADYLRESENPAPSPNPARAAATPLPPTKPRSGGGIPAAKVLPVTNVSAPTAVPVSTPLPWRKSEPARPAVEPIVDAIAVITNPSTGRLVPPPLPSKRAPSRPPRWGLKIALIVAACVVGAMFLASFGFFILALLR